MIQQLPAYWFDQTGTTQRRVVTEDSGGGVIANYTDNLTIVVMRLVVSGGGENGGNGRLNSQSPYKIFTNYADIVATDRIVCNSGVFDILSVNDPDNQHAFLVCACEQVQPSGVGA